MAITRTYPGGWTLAAFLDATSDGALVEVTRGALRRVVWVPATTTRMIDASIREDGSIRADDDNRWLG